MTAADAAQFSAWRKPHGSNIVPLPHLSLSEEEVADGDEHRPFFFKGESTCPLFESELTRNIQKVGKWHLAAQRKKPRLQNPRQASHSLKQRPLWSKPLRSKPLRSKPLRSKRNQSSSSALKPKAATAIRQSFRTGGQRLFPR